MDQEHNTPRDAGGDRAGGETGPETGAATGTGTGAQTGGATGEVAIVARGAGGGRMGRVPAGGWTKARRTRFLDHLAATGHVGMAAEAAEMHASGAYALRRRDAAFAGLWDAALEIGFARLEAELLSKALGDGINAIEPDGTRCDIGPIDSELALRLLGVRRVEKVRKGPRGPRYKEVPAEDLARAILKSLNAVEKRWRRWQPDGGVAIGGQAGGAPPEMLQYGRSAGSSGEGSGSGADGGSGGGPNDGPDNGAGDGAGDGAGGEPESGAQ